MKKLGFREWLAQNEDTKLEWASRFIEDLSKFNEHYGDCTKKSEPCSLCVLEGLLSDYHDYFFKT